MGIKGNKRREVKKEGEWKALVKGSGDKELLYCRGSFSYQEVKDQGANLSPFQLPSVCTSHKRPAAPEHFQAEKDPRPSKNFNFFVFQNKTNNQTRPANSVPGKQLLLILALSFRDPDS